MKKRTHILWFLTVALTVMACDTTGVKNDASASLGTDPQEPEQIVENVLDSEQNVSDTLKMDNGIIIRWFEHGEGEKVKDKEVISIDYKVLLDDGSVIGGNHLLKKPSFPFMVGFGTQTPGWDIALKELKVGDFVEIFIPSKLARGEKGVEGLFPPNSNNTLKIRVLNKIKPSREIDGNKVWVFEENPQNTKLFGEGKRVEFHCMAFTQTNPLFINTYVQNDPFDMNLEDNGVVPGLKKALINAKKADRMLVYVPASEAYKSKGYQNIVKPNEDIFYNVFVMNVIDE